MASVEPPFPGSFPTFIAGEVLVKLFGEVSPPAVVATG